MKTYVLLFILITGTSLIGQQSNSNVIDVTIEDESGPTELMVANPDSSSIIMKAPTSLMKFLDESNRRASLVWRNGVLDLYTMQPSPQNLGILDPTLTLDGNRRLGIGLPATATPAFLLDVNGKMRLSDDATSALPGALKYTQGNGFQGFHNGAWTSMENPTRGTKWMVGPLSSHTLIPNTIYQVTNYAYHIEDFIHSPRIEDRYEVLQAGTYLIHFQATLTQINTTSTGTIDNGIIELLIRKNGQNITGGRSRFITDFVPGYSTQLETSIMVTLDVGDDITFHVLSEIDIPGKEIRLAPGNSSGGFNTLMRVHRID